jgi:hypothetical protein
MRSWWKDRPTGRQLFRTTAVAAALGWLCGAAGLFASWAIGGYDPSLGRDCLYAQAVLTGILGWAMLTHYPWSPRWVGAMGARLADPPARP